MTLSGIFAGVPVEVVTRRAIAGLFVGLLLGLVAGWLGWVIVQENVPMPEEAETPAADTERAVEA